MIVTAEFMPDGRIVSVSADGTAKVWPADGGVEAISLRQHAMQITALAFSRDGRWLASGSIAPLFGARGTELKLWDAESGTLVRELRANREPIQSLSFSPDGCRLASSVHFIRATIDPDVFWHLYDPREGHRIPPGSF